MQPRHFFLFRYYLRIMLLLHIAWNQFLSFFRITQLKSPLMVVEVPVEKINFAVVSQNRNGRLRFSMFPFLRIPKVGKVQGGPWDLKKKNVDDMVDFRALSQRFEKSLHWEETDYYRFFEEQIALKGHMRNCKTWDEFCKKHLHRWDQLFLSMTRDGYLSQEELKSKSVSVNEVQVGISRDGEILFIDGRHRLALARILKTSKIPVIVKVWHRAFIGRILKLHGKVTLTPGEAIKYALGKND